MSNKVYLINAKNKSALMGEIWDLVTAGVARYKEIQLSLGQVKKSYIQQAKYHAMIGDIADTVTLGESRYSLKVWKAKLVVDFEAELENLGEQLTSKGQWTMSLKNQFPIYLRPSTTDFTVPEASKFIEYLYATGIEYGAKFTDQSLAIYAEYREAD
jgi:hypothetical protein